MAARVDRIVILGLDGATWTVLDPMVRRGVMPNFAALLQRAAAGSLQSCIPPVTTAAWTSMMTGCTPARHGVFDHRYYDAGAGRMKVNHSGRVRVPTVWTLLSQAKRTVAVINLPGTFPPPEVRGVIVSGMDAPNLDAALSGHSTFARRLRAEIPSYRLQFFWKRPPETLDELKVSGRETSAAFLDRAEAGLLADRVFPDWSSLMIQFQDLDPFQHRCWPLLNIDETGVDRPAWNREAEDVLRGLDLAIGRLCELADRRGAAVLAVSDHGFGPCAGRISVNRILIDAGLARLPSRATRRWALRLLVPFDRGRLWWEKRRRPESRSSSFEKSVAHEFPFDWKRTYAFVPHQDTAAMVYLNTPGRQGHLPAPLTTPRQVDEALNETAIALSEARHPETHRPLFPQILGTAETYGIDPAREGYPDLIALPDDPYWVRTRLTPSRAWVEPDPNLLGTHRMEGVVALQAPGIAAGRTLSAQLIDVAPSLLALLGEPIPDHMEGKPFACLSDLPTHRRDPGAEGLNGPHHGQFEYTPEEQAVIERRLADLGYLE